jgi:hypothetical protein
MASAAFSVPFCRHTIFVCCELCVGYRIIAMKTSTESEKLYNKRFYLVVKENKELIKSFLILYPPPPLPLEKGRSHTILLQTNDMLQKGWAQERKFAANRSHSTSNVIRRKHIRTTKC